MSADSAGNLCIAETNSHRIRKVDTSGTVTTAAGGGTGGYGGDSGPATTAKLSLPCGVAVDKAGNLYIAENRQQPDTQNPRRSRVAGVPVTTDPSAPLKRPVS
ncbi:MAG TPA: hypothetical protein VLW83_01195 [Candidatus Acidoferrales bacterium]|nr:hypothetical protein [Candidatus Acidoferrales bacterium]